MLKYSLPHDYYPEKGRGEVMLFIALAKFKKQLTKEIVAQNLEDIE